MEGPLLLQFSIALFTGMVAATLVPPVRRAIPKPLEVGLWIGLVFVCTLGIVGIADPSVRELTSSAVWGVDQIVNTAAGLMAGGVVGWISDNRFAIATLLIMLVGIDMLVLALIHSWRKAQGWQPRVHLGEWLEMPSPAMLAAQPAAGSDPMVELNRRLAVSTALAGAHAARWLADFAAVRLVAAAGKRGATSAKRDKVIDIQSLMSAQSIGWYGPLSVGAPLLLPPTEQDGAEPERSDRLAS